MKRCAWAEHAPAIYQHYHDHEWGVPLHDDRRLFEMLILEGAQAGLSWLTILKRRDGYRAAFDGFDSMAVAALTDADVARLCVDDRIIRNRLKIEAARRNARVFLAIQQEYGSFDAYLWRFVGGQPRINRPATRGDVPVRTAESDALSADLKLRGMAFVGSTIMYAYMQAVGMVNDHTQDCFCCLH